MPQSRKRQGHHEHQEQKKAVDIPPGQRVKGRVLWAILCAVFAVLIAYFGTGDNYGILIIAGLLGGAIGFAIGRAMEKDA